MGRDLGQLNFIDTIILLADMVKVLLPMQGNHGHIILVQKEKTCMASKFDFVSLYR